MPFTRSFDIENKQHLNLSVLAYDVLTSDMLIFSQNHISSFLNTIFSNFYFDAEASIAIMTSKKRDKLNNVPDIPKSVCEKLIASYIYEIKSVIDSYPKGKGFKFRINNSNMEYLSSGECNEDEFYNDRIGLYLKAVFEEYSRLPFYKREEVYLADTISLLKNAVNNKQMIKAKLPDGTDIYIKLAGICPDRLSMYHYLVGYASESHDGTFIPFSYRLSNLSRISQLKYSGFLSSAQLKSIQNDIEHKGAQFICDEGVRITVKFSAEGIRKYNRILHLRPEVINRNGNVCEFDCTERQAEYYFFKFGSDAEILEPENLRLKFANMYKNACKLYG